MIKDKYYIKKVSYSEAMLLVIKNHYLHRKAPCSFAYGLFEKETDMIVGVVVYGKPASPCLCKGVCGEDESKNVGELTRLWLSDELPKNCESFLIGNTIKQQGFEIIVSYADSFKNHVGYVYQATNWIYTGLSAKRTESYVEGLEEKHCRTLWRNLTKKQIKEIYGEKLKERERSRKHRYIYFNCNKKRKKELLSKLKYPILPYPKK
jgi:hypothetical protein